MATEGIFLSSYRIIIADDEEEIREGIQRRIDWADCGFELVATAENGQDAIEKCKAHQPDAVITDINMPFMDGLALGQWLYSNMPDVKVVIFSGFDDFEYAQKAIQLGVHEYLLKPIKADELTEVLKKLKTALDKETSERQNLDVLRQHYAESFPVLKEQFLASLIDGQVAESQIQENLARYKLELDSPYKTVIKIYASSKSADGMLAAEKELIPLSVKRLIDQELPRYCKFISFIYNECVAVIGLLERRNQIHALLRGLNNICNTAQRYLEIELSMGVGPVCDTLEDLRHSASGASSALDYRFTLGNGKVLFLEDVEPKAANKIIVDEHDKHQLILAVKMDDMDGVKRWIDKFIISSKALGMPIEEYRIFLLEILSELMSVVRTYQLDINEIMGMNLFENLNLSRFDSQQELGNWFYKTCEKICEMIQQKRKNLSTSVIEDAKAYIAENFSNPDISAEMLCEHLHLSPAYFSTLFKKETGSSFVSYLTQIRLEEAIRLLNTTQDKTYEICEKIGYSEPSYFSYVFRKRFGVSPSKYRANQEERA